MTAVMRASVLDLFPGFYNEQQVASASVHIAHVDPALVADGTYFVFETDGEVRRLRRVEPTRSPLHRLW